MIRILALAVVMAGVNSRPPYYDLHSLGTSGYGNSHHGYGYRTRGLHDGTGYKSYSMYGRVHSHPRNGYKMPHGTLQQTDGYNSNHGNVVNKHGGYSKPSYQLHTASHDMTHTLLSATYNQGKYYLFRLNTRDRIF